MARASTSIFGIAVILVTAVGPIGAQTIRGHLLDGASGTPIDLGLVILRTESGDSVTHTLTDPRGYFSITSPDPGSFELLGSGLGYEEGEAGVFELGMGGELTVEFRLAPRPLPIDELLVELDRPVLEHKLVRTGFVRRYQRNVGGHFLTPHHIERSPAPTVEALFEGLPGMRVLPIEDEDWGRRAFVGDAVLMERAAGLCEPTVYVDGVRVRYDPTTGVTLSTHVPLFDVQAVEVYRRASEVPVEYNATRRDQLCGVLVFWTK